MKCNPLVCSSHFQCPQILSQVARVVQSAVMSEAQNDPALAVASSAQLVKSSALDTDRATHINVLLAAGRAPEALPHLFLLRQQGTIEATG